MVAPFGLIAALILWYCDSFSLEAGELVGYIGPNGAGKSTTVKILSGIVVPDSGRCKVQGRVPWQDRIGVVFGQRTQLWWDLPAIESFDLLRDIYKVPSNDYRRRRDALIAMLELDSFLDVPDLFVENPPIEEVIAQLYRNRP